VGHGGALVTLDRGSEVVWAAVDSGQEWRRKSGKGCGSGKKMVAGMRSREGKKECVSSSRMCSGSRRRCGCMGAGAGTPTGVVAARATAAQHGEGGSRPTRGREGGGKAEEDAWHGL
jgi:hypothetical protein